MSVTSADDMEYIKSLEAENTKLQALLLAQQRILSNWDKIHFTINIRDNFGVRLTKNTVELCDYKKQLVTNEQLVLVSSNIEQLKALVLDHEGETHKSLFNPGDTGYIFYYTNPDVSSLSKIGDKYSSIFYCRFHKGHENLNLYIYRIYAQPWFPNSSRITYSYQWVDTSPHLTVADIETFKKEVSSVCAENDIEYDLQSNGCRFENLYSPIQTIW